jgi:N-acetyl-anhydromuramoyl-L-alanine amidase
MSAATASAPIATETASTVKPRWYAGWWSPARRCPSPNCGTRPPGTEVSLLVVHSISLPPGVYGGNAIEELFTNRLDWSAHPYFETIRGLRVSAHFLVRRDGSLLQFVSCDRRAWHAGVSTWRGRENCNDFSIGVELEGLEGEAFELSQYTALSALAGGLARRYPIEVVAGHEHVAVGRKADPGAGFDWARLRAMVLAAGVSDWDFPDSATQRNIDG